MHISTYDHAREYLESFIRPMLFKKVTLKDGQEVDPLERMRILLKLLGDPQKSFRSVVVSGSAGKGSTAYLISHILSTAGYKIGLSISPHLQKITERMQINNVNASDTEFIKLVNTIVPVIEKMKDDPIGEPSYFEILLALTFMHFAQENVDIAVIEVGIEGKYDGTNILDPLVAVLTNIALDHVEILGETVERIAEEAVSFIKSKDLIVVSGVKQPSVIDIVESRCIETGADLYLLTKHFNYQIVQQQVKGTTFSFTSGKDTISSLHVSLVGAYQAENAAVAIETVCQLSRFGYHTTEHHIKDALKTAAFGGRFEHTQFDTLTVILDGAHNPAKMQAFLSSLKVLYPEHKKIFLITFKKGKQVEEMVKMITELADGLIVTEFHRTIDYQKNASMHAEDVERIVVPITKKAGIPFYRESSAEEAIQIAARIADSMERSLLIVTGSLYLVGEVRELLLSS